MPNWCSNRLTVTGPDLDVAALHAAVLSDGDGHPELLRSLHPMPEELEHTSSPNRDASPEQRAYLVATYGADNWYDWANSSRGWGTKWGDCDTSLTDQGPGRLVYHFDTAWGPPLEGLVNVSARFPTLVFTAEYAEPGMVFSGTAVIREGLVADHDARDTCDTDFAVDCGYDEMFDEDDVDAVDDGDGPDVGSTEVDGTATTDQ